MTAVSASSVSSLRRASRVGGFRFDGGPFILGRCIQRVGAGEVLDVVRVGRVLLVHEVTPNSSRSRIMPSRRRVFTVPIGTESFSATSLWLYPP